MYRYITIIVVLALFIGCGSEQTEEQFTWYTYGGDITEQEILTVSDAVAKLDEIADVPVVVEGKITQVCQSRGCWMVIQDNESSVRVRFADYGFFVPWESAGKTVRAQGTLKIETVSEETARHWAEEANDPAVNPEDIHGDQEVVMMMATAVTIEGGLPLSDDQKAVIGDADGDQHTQ